MNKCCIVSIDRISLYITKYFEKIFVNIVGTHSKCHKN